MFDVAVLSVKIIKSVIFTINQLYIFETELCVSLGGVFKDIFEVFR